MKISIITAFAVLVLVSISFVSADASFSNPTPANNSLSKSFVINATCSNVPNFAMSRIVIANDSAFNNFVSGWNSNTASVTYDFSGLPTGSYYFVAVCINSSGGVASQSEVRRTDFNASLPNPAPTFNLPTPANNSIISSFIINMSCSPQSSQFGMSRIVIANDSAFNNFVSGWNLNYSLFYDYSGLADGTYYFIGHCIDLAGNIFFSTEVRKIELDKTAPVSALNLSYSNGTIYNGENTTSNIYATLSCADAHACTSHYRLNNGAWLDYVSTITINTVGTNILYYYSSDSVNPSNSEAIRNRTITIISSPNNNQTCSSDNDCDDDESCEDGVCVSDDNDHSSRLMSGQKMDSVCGDGVCYRSGGENEQTCASDCAQISENDITTAVLNSMQFQKKGINWGFWILIALILIIIIAIVLILVL